VSSHIQHRGLIQRLLDLPNRLERYSESETASIYLMPTVVLLVVLVLYPVIYSFWLSITDMTIGVHGIVTRFAGLKHYLQMRYDPRLPRIVIQTFRFTTLRVIGTLIIGLAIALILNVGSLGAQLFKRIFLIPWALSHVVNALMWKWMYNADYGIVNEFFLRLGLVNQYQSLLSEPATALYAILYADIWKSVPFVALMLLAALQNVHKELYEAAMVDGAGSLTCFLHVTLPSIRPVLLVNLVLQTMWALKTFDLIWVLTQGGPVDSTLTLNVYAYQRAFSFLDLNCGAALSFALAGITLVLTMLYVRLLGGEELQE
jgi:multiple sugar transport system permease protein